MKALLEGIKSWSETQFGIVFSESLKEHANLKIQQFLTQNNMQEADLLLGIQKQDPFILQSILNFITIAESYFFRDPILFNHLLTTLLPNLILKKRQEKNLSLAIWSAGCARGEEIYSIAICLKTLIPDWQQWSIKLLASDVNPLILQQAQQGEFSKRSLRGFEAMESISYDLFFKQHQDTYFLDETIKNTVQFSTINLASLKRPPGVFDIILCRNVFIYLLKSVVVTVLQVFNQSLNEEGVLFLGPSDFVAEHPGFTQYALPNLFYFKKETSLAIPSNVIVESKPDKKSLDEKITTQLKQKRFYHALNTIHQFMVQFEETALMYRYQAQAYMGMNEHQNANIALEKSLTLDLLDPTTHFLKGLLEIDLQQDELAISALERALYLKPKYPEALYYLGFLYLNRQQPMKGIKLLKQTLLCAETIEGESLLWEPASKADFIKAIKSSIALYEAKYHE